MRNVVRADDNIISNLSKIMEIKSKVQGWWYSTRVIVHVSYDKMTLKTYSEITDGQQVQMRK